VPAQILRDYIAHLSASEARLDGLRTQADIAAHLDMSERNLRDVLDMLALDHKRVTQRDIRVAYIRHLRETAAGRASGSGDGGLDLVQERAALAREQRLRLELLNATARGEYAPVSLLADVLARASAAIVSMLDQLDGRIAQTAPDLPEATRLAVLNTIASARNECVRTTASLDIGDTITTDDDEADATGNLLDDGP
jgi:phage terminase Nu1 subunit (DNA packaging protein)